MIGFLREVVVAESLSFAVHAMQELAAANPALQSVIYIYIYIIDICKHKVSYPLISCSPAPQITSTKWSPILRWSPLSSEAGILMDFVFDDHRLLMDYNK